MGTGSPGGSAVSRDTPGGEDAVGVLDPGTSCDCTPLSPGAPLARGAAPTGVAEAAWPAVEPAVPGPAARGRGIPPLVAS
jgi:hypothetical protein